MVGDIYETGRERRIDALRIGRSGRQHEQLGSEREIGDRKGIIELQERTIFVAEKNEEETPISIV